MNIKIIAKSVPTILTVLGGVGFLGDIPGASLLLTFGIIFHAVWLLKLFI